MNFEPVVKELERFFIYEFCAKLGIAPIDSPNQDFHKLMSTLPPEEARALKRKFRKLWRKAARNLRRSVPVSPAKRVVEHTYGMYPKTNPNFGSASTKSQKHRRKSLVFGLLLDLAREELKKRGYVAPEDDIFGDIVF